MEYDVIGVESMQWNRTHGNPGEPPGLHYQDMTGQAGQISPEIMAQVQAAISAEVAKASSREQ